MIHQRSFQSALIISLSLAAYCGFTSAARGEQVANREYVAWAKLKPGAGGEWVVETKEDKYKNVEGLTKTLVSVAPDKVVVEKMEPLVKDGKIEEGSGGPPTNVEIPAKKDGKMRRPTTGESAEIVPATRKKTEVLEVDGKKFTCTITAERAYSEGTIGQGKPVTRTTWWCDQVPGGYVKMIETDGDDFSRTVTLVKITAK